MSDPEGERSGTPIVGLLAAGCAIFAGVGLIRGLVGIVEHLHLGHRTYVLAVLDLQRALNESLLVFGLVAAAVAILAGLYTVWTRNATRASSPTAAPGRVARSTLVEGMGVLIAFLVAWRVLGLAYAPHAGGLLPDAGLEAWGRDLSAVSRATAGAVAATGMIFACMAIGATGAHHRAARGVLRASWRPGIRRLGLVILAAVAVFNLGSLAWTRSHAPRGRNVLLITVDTLRADHLSSYGNARPVSPYIDALARKGVLFESAIAQAPWTLPSMASLHTSLYPSEHGAVHYETRVPRRLLTLAERFRNALYTTIAVTSHTFVDRTYGFAQGFAVFDRENIVGHVGVSSVALTDAAIEHMQRSRGESFFLWVHYFDPHYSYLAHDAFPYDEGYRGDLPDDIDIDVLRGRLPALNARDLDHVRAVYDGEISYTDREIGRLLEALDDLGLGQTTIVAVTGDHGEEFLEHGDVGHGRQVYQELVHVPLILYDPAADGLAGARVNSPVEVRSLGRTLLEAAGLDAMDVSGANLLGVASGDPPPPRVFSEGSHAWGRDGRRIAMIEGDRKLILNLDESAYELYDLALDPGERVDLYGAEGRVPGQADLEASLHAFLEILEPRASRGAGATLDPQERERLRALGYVQ